MHRHQYRLRGLRYLPVIRIRLNPLGHGIHVPDKLINSLGIAGCLPGLTGIVPRVDLGQLIIRNLMFFQGFYIASMFQNGNLLQVQSGMFFCPDTVNNSAIFLAPKVQSRAIHHHDSPSQKRAIRAQDSVNISSDVA